MAHRTRINGTAYDVVGGKCKVNGTGYSIKGGKTKVGGTGYSINFFPKPVWNNIGDVITWDEKEWLVCHYDSNLNQVYLIANNIVSKTVFGSNTDYLGSTIASVAMDYQNNSISSGALSMIVNTTVEGVTAKVFVPTYTQMNGGFSWFNSNTRRKATSADGTTKVYWTSTKATPTTVNRVLNTGELSHWAPSAENGFRPCVCVQM